MVLWRFILFLCNLKRSALLQCFCSSCFASKVKAVEPRTCIIDGKCFNPLVTRLFLNTICIADVISEHKGSLLSIC